MDRTSPFAFVDDSQPHFRVEMPQDVQVSMICADYTSGPTVNGVRQRVAAIWQTAAVCQYVRYRPRKRQDQAGLAG